MHIRNPIIEPIARNDISSVIAILQKILKVFMKKKELTAVEDMSQLENSMFEMGGGPDDDDEEEGQSSKPALLGSGSEHEQQQSRNIAFKVDSDSDEEIENQENKGKQSGAHL